MKNQVFPKLSLRIAALTLVAVQACSSQSTGDGASLVSGKKPANSSGKAVDVTLQMSTEIGNPGLKLAATGLDLGNGIVLTDARVNIAKIKIKADRDEDSDEKSLQDEVEARAHEQDSDHDEQESEVDAAKDALKAKYRDLFAAATTEAEKEAVEEAYEKDKHALEAQIADLKKDDEDAADAIEVEKDGDIKWKGPYVYDLVNAAVSPELPASQVWDGTYHRIQFQLKPNRTATDGLLNNSIYLKGTSTVNGTATDFSFALNSSENIRLLSTDGVAMATDAENVLTIAFQPAEWFANIDLSQATANELGLVVIDNQNNQDLYKAIRHNIKASTLSGKDSDRDGHLHKDESKADGKDDADDDSEEEAESSTEDHSEHGSGKKD